MRRGIRDEPVEQPVASLQRILVVGRASVQVIEITCQLSQRSRLLGIRSK